MHIRGIGCAAEFDYKLQGIASFPGSFLLQVA